LQYQSDDLAKERKKEKAEEIDKKGRENGRQTIKAGYLAWQ